VRDAGIPPYNRLPPDPSFQVCTLGPEPTEIVEIDWNGKGGKILGPNAYLRFDPRPFPTARSRKAQSGLVERKSTPGNSGPGAFLTKPRPLARVGGRKKSAASHEDAPGDFALVAYSPHCRIAPVSALVAILA
jgi:hypothetical protein